MEERYAAVVPTHPFANEALVDKESLYPYRFMRIDDAVLDDYFTFTRTI